MKTSAFRGGSLAAAVLVVLLAAGNVGPVQAQQPRRGATTRIVTGGGPLDITTLPAPSTQPATATSQPATKPVTKVSDALDLYNKGDYASAAAGYRKFLDADATRLAASIGLARALEMRGEYAEAIDALSRAKDAGRTDADWLLEMAEALAAVGKYEEALASAENAWQVRPAWAPAIFTRGQLLEVLGRREKAVEAYKGMEKAMDKDDWKRDPRSLVALGKILDRYTILTSKKASAQGDNIFQNYLQAAYKVDPNNWQAYVASGMFALSKHRPNMAAGEFQAAAKINKNIPDVHIGMGMLMAGAMNFEGAIKEANAALAINPHLPDAYLLKAVALMQWRKHIEAVPDIEAALAVNPNYPDALAMMASVYYCTRKPDKAQPYIDRALKVNPTPSDLYNQIGQWLSSIRQYDEAEKQFRKSIELAPELSEAWTNLGLLYMQTGAETKAKETLDKAHELDDYRADVVNYLQILDKLSRFAVKESPHFIIKVDPEFDGVLLNQVSDYMETIYPEIASDYGFELPFKVAIEIFPTQAGFSTRLSGQGWIPTVGACTGRVIVLAAPSRGERTPLSTYNWSVVLRHEFTHAVTLTQTDNRIPHWFTEACAVSQQPDKQAYNHVQALVTATREGLLYPVKDLDWGFIRPRPLRNPRVDPRHLAYCQAEWNLEFLIASSKYVPAYDVIPKMLQGFHDGLTQAEVFEKIVGLSEKDFDKAFDAWAHKTVKEWGFNPERPPVLADAAKAAADRPADPLAHADHAVALCNSRQLPQALEAAGKALALDANNSRAQGVKAMAFDAQKKYDDAVEAANRLEQLDHDSYISPRVLADCYLNMKGDAAALRAKAIPALELLQQRQPLEEFSYQQLYPIYLTMGEPGRQRALANLIHLHRHTMNDPKYARQAAEIYRTMKQYDQALYFFRQVTYINPYDASTYEAIASLELRAKKPDLAVDAARNITLLQPDSAKAWAILANVRLGAAKGASNKELLLQAKADAQKSITLDAEGPGKDVLENIEEALKGL